MPLRFKETAFPRASRTTYLQELVELHLPVFVEIHLVEDLVEGVLVHLHADALHRTSTGRGSASLHSHRLLPEAVRSTGQPHLQHTLHVQDRYEALLVLVKHAEPLLVPAREGPSPTAGTGGCGGRPGLTPAAQAALLPHSPLNI